MKGSYESGIKRVWRFLVGASRGFLLLVASLFLVASCSNDARQAPPNQVVSPGSGSLTQKPARPSVRILTPTESGGLKEYFLPVIRETSRVRALSGTSGSSGPGGGPPLAAQDIVTADGEDLDLTAGWWILAGAAAECNVYAVSTDEPRDAHGIDGDPIVPPWKPVGLVTAPWFVFPNAPQSCDELTLQLEALTCMAQRLDSLAEALAPVRWEKTQYLTPPTPTVPTIEYPAGPWIIAPQSPENRVVLRDMARLVLVQVPSLAATRVPEQTSTCAELYAGIVDDPLTLDDDLATAVFGHELGVATVYPALEDLAPDDPAFPTLEAEDAARLAGQRLAIITHVLRAAGQLLESNVRAAVTEDLA